MTIGTRYITKDRKPLETLLPLESPLVLFIDPSDACCLKCNFCPTGNMELMKQVKRPLKQMNFSLYKKIIDDLQQFETSVKVVRLYSHGEPLLNRNFCDMVKYAKESNKVETVDTTTNGILLMHKFNYQLIDSGIDRINISVNGLSDEQYMSFTNTKLDFKKYVKNIEHLYKNKKDTYIFIKINGDTISEEEEQKFLEIFEPIADTVAIEKSMNCWTGFEPKGFIRHEDNKGIYGQAIDKEVDVCPYIMYSYMINSNGECSLCFLDWSLKMNIGDINNESVSQIWNGYKLREMRKIMLYKERKLHPICSKCDQLLKGMPSNIDPYRKELIKKYNF
jgi:radical SAM protein with 4Fe4S-binding SPASM domain